MIRRFDVRNVTELERGLTAASAAAKRGEVVVVPTESAYGLATDAFSADGVNRLRELKHRGPDLPLPVMVGATMTVDGIVSGISTAARELMATFWPGMLTLVGLSQPTLTWGVCALGDNSLSVRMPLHPVAWQVAKRVGPLALSGANIAGTDLPRTCQAAVEQFEGAVGVYLDAGELTFTQTSTIVDITTDPPTLVRPGAVTLEQLRQVCPTLVDPAESEQSEPGPGPEQSESTGSEGAGASGHADAPSSPGVDPSGQGGPAPDRTAPS